MQDGSFIDTHVNAWMNAIKVDEDELPELRKVYLEELEGKLGKPEDSEQEHLEAALQRVNDAEMHAVRLYTAGGISDDAWDTLWRDWKDRGRAIKASLESL
jgi:hypothetical protein